MTTITQDYDDLTALTKVTDAQIRLAFETGYYRCLIRRVGRLPHDTMVTEADRAAEQYLADLRRLRDARIAAEDDPVEAVEDLLENYPSEEESQS